MYDDERRRAAAENRDFDADIAVVQRHGVEDPDDYYELLGGAALGLRTLELVIERRLTMLDDAHWRAARALDAVLKTQSIFLDLLDMSSDTVQVSDVVQRLRAALEGVGNV